METRLASSSSPPPPRLAPPRLAPPPPTPAADVDAWFSEGSLRGPAPGPPSRARLGGGGAGGRGPRPVPALLRPQADSVRSSLGLAGPLPCWNRPPRSRRAVRKLPGEVCGNFREEPGSSELELASRRRAGKQGPARPEAAKTRPAAREPGADGRLLGVYWARGARSPGAACLGGGGRPPPALVKSATYSCRRSNGGRPRWAARGALREGAAPMVARPR
ncbi:translation initiation factor IF-2-like [Psammomys obesus]|uniref:translation initiation factor IF-2-like n=1 Tax=Psammomys obesus TaxID=48139 RepID=UPI002452BA18|nr:translation initiation factor IF-2-like [Psammomys obesus]